MSQKVFDLDGWNTNHFVGNLIANREAISKKLFSICFHKKITENHQQLQKKHKIWEKKIIFLHFIS